MKAKINTALFILGILLYYSASLLASMRWNIEHQTRLNELNANASGNQFWALVMDPPFPVEYFFVFLGLAVLSIITNRKIILSEKLNVNYLRLIPTGILLSTASYFALFAGYILLDTFNP